MEAIRKMEPAWVKICGSNFRLTSRTVVQPNGGTRDVPCYMLTKTETLYIATKFKDDMRAKLVLRWEEWTMSGIKRKEYLQYLADTRDQEFRMKDAGYQVVHKSSGSLQRVVVILRRIIFLA